MNSLNIVIYTEQKMIISDSLQSKKENTFLSRFSLSGNIKTSYSFLTYNLSDNKNPQFILKFSRAVVFNLWLETPLEVDRLLHMSCIRSSENTNIYNMVYNSSKN